MHNWQIPQRRTTQSGAIVQEIFSGIQGEGILVGVRQIFLRFHGCQLHCRYCDTPASRQAPPEVCAVERAAGSRELFSLPNPLSVEDILRILSALQQGCPHHSVSLTGGEPLLHRPFLEALLPELSTLHLPGYLETNGVLADEMAALVTPPGYVAMDIKLPSATGGDAYWDAHAAFLAVAYARLTRLPGEVTQRLQVKIVFAEDTCRRLTMQRGLSPPCAARSPACCNRSPRAPADRNPRVPPPCWTRNAARPPISPIRASSRRRMCCWDNGEKG